MKKIISLFAIVFSVIIGFAQDKAKSKMNSDRDSFTYKKIDILERKQESFTLSGISNNKETKGNQEIVASKNSDSGIGETLGELSVSSTGAAVYNLPIAVPAGIKGVVPDVSLTYNSQRGNGIVGYGWSINGVSSIGRIPSTTFHDGEVDEVDFDNLDRFALDGNRLVLKSGTYGANGAVYETETYSNLKITSYGVSSLGSEYGPSYFVVNYPNGSIGYYGATSNSSSPTKYALTYWQDPQGIRINYEYGGTNTLYLRKINYGGLLNGSSNNEIEFRYEPSGRPEEAYIKDKVFRSAGRINTILVKSNNILYRRYEISYNFSKLSYSRVANIKEFSGDGTLSHSPVYFNYSNTAETVTADDITTNLGLININQGNSTVTSLDLTGNGRMDFFVTPNSKNKFWLFKDLDPSTNNVPYEINTGAFEEIFPVNWINSNNKYYGGQGLAVVQETDIDNVKFKVYANGTVQPIYLQYTKTWNAPTYNYAISPTKTVRKKIPKKYISGDFNGDGLTDVIAIGKPYQNRYCYSYECKNTGDVSNKIPDLDPDDDPDGGTCYSCSNDYTVNFNGVYFIDLKQDVNSGGSGAAGFMQQVVKDTDKIYTGDFNGDGKTDIMHVTDGKLFVSSLNDSGYLTLLWQITNDASIQPGQNLLLGDFNGDGKTDFMDPVGNGSNKFNTYMSNGVGFHKQSQNNTFPFVYRELTTSNVSNFPTGFSTTFNGYNLVAADINGDGRTDIIDYSTITSTKNSNGSQTVKVYKNKGMHSVSSVRSPYFEFGGSATRSGNLENYPIPVFLNSDQPTKSLEFASISNKWVTKFAFNMDHRQDVLLESVVNNAVTYRIDYNTLDPSQYNNTGANYNPIYTSNYNEDYPNINVQVDSDTNVVTLIKRVCSNTETLKKVYFYQGAVYNVQGLGFLGFQGMAESNWYTNTSDIIYTVSKYDPMLRGAKIVEYSTNYNFSFNEPTSNYIIKTNYNNAFSLSATKVFKLWETSILTQNALAGTNTNTTFQYDSYNNPTKITKNYLGAGTSVVDITYENNLGTDYYVGRTINEIETKTISGETFSIERQYIYSGYLLTEQKTRGNGTPFDRETFEYDVFGNVTKKRTIPNNTTPREINLEYDPSGRFLSKMINVEGLEINYEYNVNTGNLTKETNPFGQETSYEYDSWFRPIKLIDYLGNELTNNFVETNYSYTVTDVSDDGSSTIKIFDPLGRLATIKEKNILGQWVSVSYLYDKFDRIWKESEPYTGASASQWNETKYDFYGRPITKTLYTGRVINYSYNGLSMSVNDGTKVVTTNLDAMGNKVSVTDPGGTINYTYYGNGNLKTSNYNGVVVSVEQDGWGRKKKLTDPSAGVFEYSYNGFGEIINETTPKGETDYVYSPVGKLLEKNVSGDQTNMAIQYAYDSTSKFLNSVTLSNADGNNSTYNYTYDNYYRVTNIAENNTYAEFTKAFTYDSFGRIDTEEYYARLLANNTSSIKKIRNVYQYGEIKAIKDFVTNETIWNIDAVNARGQLTSATMGNNIKEQNTYNSYGYLTETKVNKNALTAPEEIMKLNFNFDTQKGLLNSRTNTLFSWSETFGYDNLDRLVTFNDNNGNNGHTYDSRGRIVSNNTIGDYNYTGNSYQLGNVDLNNQGDLYYQQNRMQVVKYNAFKKPTEISEIGKEKVGFQYNAFMGRSHMFYGDNQDDVLQRRNRKHYSYEGSMEINFDTVTDKTIFVTYIGGDAYTAPAIWRSEIQGSSPTNDFYFLHRDYLGSILMISDKDGNVEEKRHFDAWGNIVRVADGNNNTLEKLEFIDRGYTGHEHLQGVSLIHMNGRLYDPKLRRFLAPDNYIQDVTNTQNFNRYGYVLNNPLSNTDPTGEVIEPFSFLVIVAIIAVTASATVGTYALIKNLNDQSSGSGSSPSNPISSASQNNSQEITSGVTPYGLDYKLDKPIGVYQAMSLQAENQPINAATAQAAAITSAIFNNLSNGNAVDGGGDEGITAGDVVDTVTDFIPIVGSAKDIYQGVRDGNWWQLAAGVGGLALDVATLGTASLVKGAIKTGIKQGAKAIAKGALKKSACFVEGTLVKTVEGDKAIENIKVGDKVWAYNESTKKNELRKVVRTFIREKETIYVLKIGNTIVETTDEHPFYINNKWLAAKNLKQGDIVTLISGKKSPINEIRIVQKNVKVYNFEVEGLHNYYVSNLGVLVHNTCNLIKGQLNRKASSMLITKPNTKTWNTIVDQVKNVDFMKKGQRFQTRVGSKADADRLLKDMMGNMNRYKNHARYNNKYKKGFEVHQQGLEGGYHDLFHIKWYNGNTTGHIFY